MKTHFPIHKQQKKLNHYIKIPVNDEEFIDQQPNIVIKRSSTRLATEQSTQKSTHFHSSFYDNFQFIDRLTNNKMAYKEARKQSTSMSQFKKTSKMIDDKASHLKSLLSIYKKTKDFQMNSLKKKIFKNTATNQNKNDLRCKTEQSFYKKSQLQKGQKKVSKCGSFIIQSSPSTSQFIEQSRKKNKFRSFIEKTVNQINKSQLQRIITENDFNIKPEIITANQQKIKIMCSLDKEKVEDLLYLKSKQQFQLGKTEYFKKKDDTVVFKDLSNFHKDPSTIEQKQLTQTQYVEKQKLKRDKNGKNKRNPTIKDTFLEKMIIHAQSCIKKQGQFLISPSKDKLRKNMLLKKGKKKFLLSYKNSSVNTSNNFDISSFEFEKRQETSLVQEVKYQLAKNNRKQTEPVQKEMNMTTSFSEFNNLDFSNGKLEKIDLKQDQKRILDMMRSNYVSALSMQLTTYPQVFENYKDSKNNNLLHLAVKKERYQILELILKKLPYKVSRYLLSSKNSNKRTPDQLATMVMDRQAMQIIQRFWQDNRDKLELEILLHGFTSVN